jgi:radical SAM protein with 4Fe4S-binding SPASM domain
VVNHWLFSLLNIVMDTNKLPPAFCVLPWMHTAINPNGDVMPCCMSKYGFAYGNLNKTPLLKDIFNNDTAKSVRKEMLESDQLPEICTRCSYVETVREGGVTEPQTESYRQRMNKKYKDFIETLEPKSDGSAEFRQLYIDYRFSNKCNFKCITCGPTLSSSHAVEFKKLAELVPSMYGSKSTYGSKKPNETTPVAKALSDNPSMDGSRNPDETTPVAKALSDNPSMDGSRNPDEAAPMTKALIEVDHASMFEQFKEFGHEVREIYFAGGEPLINDHHYEILQFMIDSQQPVNIYYNTNFSELRYRNHNLFDMWRRVNGNVDIFASIDGYGPEGEAIRFGLDSNAFKDNVNTLVAAKIPNVNLHFSITFGIANYHSVVDTTAWLAGLFPDWYRNERNIISTQVGYNPITFSKEFSTLFMNQRQRQEAIDLVTKQIEEFEEKFGKQYSEDLRSYYLTWISNLHRAAYGNEGKREMILTRWGYMNRTDKIREIDWKQRLPNLARLWAEIWNELDQQGVDMYIRNSLDQTTIIDIDAYVAEHKIGQL